MTGDTDEIKGDGTECSDVGTVRGREINLFGSKTCPTKGVVRPKKNGTPRNTFTRKDPEWSRAGQYETVSKRDKSKRCIVTEPGDRVVTGVGR